MQSNTIILTLPGSGIYDGEEVESVPPPQLKYETRDLIEEEMLNGLQDEVPRSKKIR